MVVKDDSEREVGREVEGDGLDVVVGNVASNWTEPEG